MSYVCGNRLNQRSVKLKGELRKPKDKRRPGGGRAIGKLPFLQGLEDQANDAIPFHNNIQ